MKRVREVLSLMLRLGVAVAVIGYLLHKMGLAQLAQTLHASASQWPWLLAALLLVLLPLLLCMARWKLILDAQDMHLTWRRAGTIFFVGLFFNAFMIGPTGGDLIKAYYTSRETQHKKTEAVTTIFIDRVVGLFVLALMVGTVILARWSFFTVDPKIKPVAVTALAVCGAIVGGGIVAFSVHLFEAMPWLRRWQGAGAICRVFETLERAYNAFYVCRARPQLLLRLIAYSLAVQLLFVVVGSLVGRALGLTFPLLDYLSFAPLTGLIGAIPVTPGGIGIREGGSILLWATLGVPTDKAFLIAFLPYLALVLWGLPGGILFLFYRASAGQPPSGETDEANEVDTPGRAPS